MRITLAAARVNAGLSQQQAADEIDVSRETISNWESGKTIPRNKYIPGIERVYGVSCDDIIFYHKNTRKA